MSSAEEVAFELKIELAIEAANDYRISENGGVGVVAENPPRFVQAAMQSGRSFLRQNFGTNSYGTDALDAAEYQMRLGGMSRATTNENIMALSRLVFMPRDERVPALLIADGPSRGPVGVVLFGTPETVSPNMIVCNYERELAPRIEVKYGSPTEFSDRQAFRIGGEGKWRICSHGVNPGFDKLLITEDPERAVRKLDNQDAGGVVLVGASAVAETLKQVTPVTVPEDETDIIEAIVLRTEYPFLKVPTRPIKEIVEELYLFAGGTRDRYMMPATIHGEVLGSFEIQTLREEIIEQLNVQRDGQFFRELDRSIRASDNRRTEDIYQATTFYVASAIRQMLVNVGYKDAYNLVETAEFKQFLPFILDILKAKQKQLMRRNFIARPRTARHIMELEVRNMVDR